MTEYCPGAIAPLIAATSGAFAPVSTASGANATAAPEAEVSLTVVTANSGRSENQNRNAAGAVATVSFALGWERMRWICALDANSATRASRRD